MGITPAFSENFQSALIEQQTVIAIPRAPSLAGRKILCQCHDSSEHKWIIVNQTLHSVQENNWLLSLWRLPVQLVQYESQFSSTAAKQLLKPQKPEHIQSVICQRYRARSGGRFSHSVVCLWVNRVQSSTATWWAEGTPEKSIWTGTFRTWTRSCTTTRKPTGGTTTCRCRTTGSIRSVPLDGYTHIFSVSVCVHCWNTGLNKRATVT